MKDVVDPAVFRFLERHHLERFLDDEHRRVVATQVRAHRAEFFQTDHLAVDAVLHLPIEIHQCLSECLGSRLAAPEEVERQPFRGLWADSGELTEFLNRFLDLGGEQWLHRNA